MPRIRTRDQALAEWTAAPFGTPEHDKLQKELEEFDKAQHWLLGDY